MKKTTKVNPKNQRNIVPNSAKNRPKIVPKSAQNGSKISSGADVASESVFVPILDRFLAQLGAILGAKLGPCRAKKLIFGGSRRHAKTTMISNTLRDPLGTDFGTILGSKIVPKSVQNRSQERTSQNNKNAQNHRQGRCF